ncbi:MAG TPA: hypothetical protein VNS83_09575 [Lapillicoccus sp.]|nr:hypothetical protein [Lapillicoccus sp.]
MAGRQGRRRFGAIRRLPSGRYRTTAGRSVTTPTTFEAKADAGRYLSKIETDMLRGEWADRWGSSGWLTEHHASTRGRARARLASSCDLGGCAVGTIHVRSLDQPDETRSFPNGVVEMVTIADTMVGRARFQPGWRWSSDAKPT